MRPLNRVRTVLAVIVAAALVPCASAGAVTVGQTGTGSPTGCAAGYIFTELQSSNPTYVVPAGGGVIDTWSTATAGATAGGPITLLVLQPGGGGYTVAAFDTEKLPTPLPTPAGAVVTFTPPTPLAAPPGSVLALYSTGPGAQCLFSGASTDILAYNMNASAPANGGTYNTTQTLASYRLNVSANLVQTLDAGLTGSVAPATAIAGGVAAFTFVVSATGTATSAVTFSDSIPTGLTIVSATAGSGTCNTISQLVTCTLPAVAPGANAPVTIVVSANAPGTYSNSAAVTTNIADANPANNAATSTLTVVPAPVAPPPVVPPACRVVTLKGITLTFAKTLLPVLNCKVGKITRHTSKTIAKGRVISTSPGSGTKPGGTKVNIIESSGKPKPKKVKKTRKR